MPSPNTPTFIPLLVNFETIGSAIHHGVTEIVIRYDEIELRVGQLALQAIDAIVEIMVSNRRPVVTQFTHHFKLKLSAKVIEIGRSLENVTCVKEQCVRILLSDALNQACTTRDASHAWVPGMIHFESLDMAVNVIGVQDGNLAFRTFRTGSQRAQTQTQAGTRRQCIS